MPEMTLTQCSDMLIASTTSEMYPNSTLPKMLVEYLVDFIRHTAFKDENNNGLLDTKSQFELEFYMLEMVSEDPI